MFTGSKPEENHNREGFFSNFVPHPAANREIPLFPGAAAIKAREQLQRFGPDET